MFCGFLNSDFVIRLAVKTKQKDHVLDHTTEPEQGQKMSGVFFMYFM